MKFQKSVLKKSRGYSRKYNEEIQIMKRGISPLIASVLLIAFVVAIFIVIFNLTRETVESGFEKGEEVFEGFSNCDEVKFFVENAYCDGGLLRIKIKNEKKINFKDAFAVELFYSDGSTEIKSNLYDTVIDAYEVKEIGISRTPEEEAGPFGMRNFYKEISSIGMIPKVKAGDDFKFCQNKKKKIEVKNCSES